ncbi:MAG: 50S ribosomal protein L21 [Bacteroidota bacterium]
MYAVVNIQGFQFKVETGQQLYVHRLPNEEGDTVDFNEVLLVDNDGSVTVGKPHIEGANVKAKVLGHLKDDKVIVFKKKRRKGFRKKNGHRQALSQIEIESITA